MNPKNRDMIALTARKSPATTVRPTLSLIIPANADAGAPTETSEPPLAATGCFRSGSSRAEVRAVMGAPDTVDFGAWMYGRSSVTFGYGVVLDYSNQGDNLRLC